MFLLSQIPYPDPPGLSSYSPAVRRVMFPIWDPGCEMTSFVHPSIPSTPACGHLPHGLRPRRPHAARVKRGLVTRRTTLWIRLRQGWGYMTGRDMHPSLTNNTTNSVLQAPVEGAGDGIAHTHDDVVIQ